jgi:hypothetical protein
VAAFTFRLSIGRTNNFQVQQSENTSDTVLSVLSVYALCLAALPSLELDAPDRVW